MFGALYAVIIVAVAGAKQWLGTSGLYAVAAMSGLTDMDAITLSTAQLAASDGVKVGTAWRMIMLASLCNLAFKGAMVAMLGERRLMMRVGVLFGLAMAAGVVIMLAWPS